MKKYILLILVVALALRLVAINQSLWLDEAIGALVVKNQTFFQILTEFSKHDNHPPLYYLTLKLWSNLFGYSEVALRSLSVIFGIGTIYMVYKIGNILRKHLGGLAAVLIATSQFHIYYSQEARMYMMAAFLALLAFYLFIKEKWIFYSITITALVFTDYMPVFLLPVFWLIGLASRKSKKWWRNLAVSFLPLTILGVLWIPTFLVQSQGGKWLLETLPGWVKVAGGATPKQLGLIWAKFVFGRISFSDKVLYYSLVGFFSIPFSFAFYKAFRERKEVVSLWLYLLVPFVLGFITSLIFPAFIYFRFLYVLPAFYLLTAWGIEKFKGKTRFVLVGIILLGNIFAWFIYIRDPYQRRGQGREAVKFVESRVGRDEMVVFSFTEPFAPYQWYSNKTVKAIGLTDSIAANPIPTREKSVFETFDSKGVYYFEYLWELHDPERIVVTSLGSEGFIEAAAFDFPGVGIVRYLQKP